jgi:hypothetical protein
MDYRKLLLDYFKLEKIDGYNDLVNDYNKLLEMKKKTKIDINEVFKIWDKYKYEINEIDNYRIISCRINNIKVESNTITNDDLSIDILLNYIVSILCLRYCKDLIDEKVKRNLLSLNEKAMYDLLTRIRDRK